MGVRVLVLPAKKQIEKRKWKILVRIQIHFKHYHREMFLYVFIL